MCEGDGYDSDYKNFEVDEDCAFLRDGLFCPDCMFFDNYTNRCNKIGGIKEIDEDGEDEDDYDEEHYNGTSSLNDEFDYGNFDLFDDGEKIKKLCDSVERYNCFYCDYFHKRRWKCFHKNPKPIHASRIIGLNKPDNYKFSKQKVIRISEHIEG